ncbi:MAG: 16S rRNA (guanine1207-N2)-methyltransferase, partial [Myxococcota bacterium]
VEHTSYPGVFAKGTLDAGSAALLNAMPPLGPKVRLLDFACGAGVIGGALLRKRPEMEVWMTDADAVSVKAAAENVPEARVLCGDGWRAVPTVRHFHMIVANPPIHTGKGRDYSVLNDFISQAPTRMRDKAQLWLVAQRQVPANVPLSETFSRVRVAWEDSRYRVWCAEIPQRKKKR